MTTLMSHGSLICQISQIHDIKPCVIPIFVKNTHSSFMNTTQGSLWRTATAEDFRLPPESLEEDAIYQRYMSYLEEQRKEKEEEKRRHKKFLLEHREHPSRYPSEGYTLAVEYARIRANKLSAELRSTKRYGGFSPTHAKSSRKGRR